MEYPNYWKPKKINIKQTGLSKFGKQFGDEFAKTLVSGYRTTSKPVIKFEKEHEKSKKDEEDFCPDCGVTPGHYHKRGCDVEHCPICGRQLISCDHYDVVKQKDKMKWTGEWPGTKEIRKYGLYTKTGAEDYNRLFSDEFRWSRNKKTWIKR